MPAEPAPPRTTEWVIRPAPEAVAEAFCAKLAARLAPRIAPHDGPLTVALTGGHSAQAFYTAMASQFAVGSARGWRPEQFLFFWSDERLVPPGHPDSNYRMARETFLDPAGIPAAQIHRVPTEFPDAPARYASLLRRLLPRDQTGTPRFDVLILGLGEDGHTASLFPHTDLWHDDAALVRYAAATADHPQGRATFTPRLLNAAAEVWFLITGEKKAAAAARLQARQSLPEEIPALVVDPVRTRITHFLDGSAARLLPAALRA